MSLVSQQDLFLRDVVKLLAEAWRLGFTVTGGELFRTQDQQNIYIAQRKSKTSNSMHLRRLAIDLNLFLEGRLATAEEIKPLGQYWEGLNPANRWGGSWRGLVEAGKSDFVDSPHFERQVRQG